MAEPIIAETRPLVAWQTGRAVRRLAWLLLLPGALAFLAWAWTAGWPPGAILAVDLNQQRLNTAVPAPQETRQIRQTFTPRRDGLAEVELLLVRYDGLDDGGRLTLQLLDQAGNLVAAAGPETSTLAHNQSYTLSFPPQPHSAGQQYTLLISGPAQNPISAWGYDQDVHAGGELTLVGGETAVQDLRLVTRYRLTPAAVLAALWHTFWPNAGLIALSLAYLLLPGCLLLLAGRFPGRWDGLAWWGLALALGLAAWPLLWLWLTLLGGRWTGWLLWVLLVLGWAAAGCLFVVHMRRGQPIAGIRGFGDKMRKNPLIPQSSPTMRFHWQHTLLLLILAAGLGARLLAVRDLAFLPWVDASRHGLIAALMAAEGRMIDDYTPLLPVDQFPYHAGFHTLPAGLHLLAGFPLPGLLLVLQQFLGALAPLTIYTAGWLLTRRRSVGLLAAFLVALPFFFPAYYTAWGRLTQLAAVIVLPPAVALTWLLLRGGRGWRPAWWLVGLLAAGLFLIHFRVFLFYLPFAGLVWLVTGGRNGRWLLAAAGLALLAISPRTVQLATNRRITDVFTPLPGYNDFPVGYLTLGWEQAFLWLAAGGLLLAVVGGLRRQRWAMLPLLLVGWAALVVLLLSGPQLGLPETVLINLNSAYITFFVPLSLLLAVVAGRLGRWLGGRHWVVQAAGYNLAGAVLAGACLFGLRQQATILNPQTILAEPQDLAGLAWLAENTPPEAKIAVNGQRWLGGTWAGSDGGAWVTPLTGRQSTTPPIDYIYDYDLAVDVHHFNEIAAAVEDWASPSAGDWLQERGVTHVFVGVRGGFFDPAALARNPSLQLLYSHDGVFIFAVNRE
ncbi:MAG: hypothetical protein L0332_11395 [Chloroflexi bacterium]|nr:hypothetical protein [Chloroflexota bacterium]MCI0575893.1 hypothetical protein [Chloroflexota bacterium]MCI0648549.1 hypothetical protein [Chloroflexota bacterium]MCI0727312.1 hypothetical protein [Chloroflexota bacterium]